MKKKGLGNTSGKLNTNCDEQLEWAVRKIMYDLTVEESVDLLKTCLGIGAKHETKGNV